MTQFEELRQKLISTINQLPEDKLIEIDALVRKISLEQKNSIEYIYNEAKKNYNQTLQKLAK